MQTETIFSYLAAAALSDGPLEGKERDLLLHLIRDFGANMQQAQAMVSEVEAYAGRATNLSELESKPVAWKVLRALLVISYCDGSFDREEVPFLANLVDRFGFSASELNRAKQQALYFLRPEFPSVQFPAEAVQAQAWKRVCESAQEHVEYLRQEYFRQFQSDLAGADAETCYIAMSVGPPSFDTEHTESRFLQANPDFMHADDSEALQMLRDHAEFELRKRWEAAYTANCGSCFLEAPGRRRDSCPRCQREYGVSAR